MDAVILCWTAAMIAFIHTVLGPDHYLPFIVMNRARKWSAAKTAWITFFCGIGHVGSSVVLGLIGIACGIAVMKIQAFEAFRGNLAAWGMSFARFGKLERWTHALAGGTICLAGLAIQFLGL